MTGWEMIGVVAAVAVAALMALIICLSFGYLIVVAAEELYFWTIDWMERRRGNAK